MAIRNITHLTGLAISKSYSLRDLTIGEIISYATVQGFTSEEIDSLFIEAVN